jgi:hypothetical protein
MRSVHALCFCTHTQIDTDKQREGGRERERERERARERERDEESDRFHGLTNRNVSCTSAEGIVKMACVEAYA